MADEQTLSGQAYLEFLPQPGEVVTVVGRDAVRVGMMLNGRGREVEGHPQVSADDVDNGLPVLGRSWARRSSEYRSPSRTAAFMARSLHRPLVQVGDSLFGDVVVTSRRPGPHAFGCPDNSASGSTALMTRALSASICAGSARPDRRSAARAHPVAIPWPC